MTVNKCPVMCSMTALVTKCGKCGKLIDDGQVFTDYDNIDRCLRCDLENDLKDVIRRRDELKEWLEDTYLKYLREREAEIVLLQKRLRELPKEQK